MPPGAPSEATAAFTSASGGLRVLLHGLLAPGQQTEVCEPVQTAWVTHDRLREAQVNINFFRALTTSNENYIRYAVASSQHLRHLHQEILKLSAKVQAPVTIALLGRQGGGSRSKWLSAQLIIFVEQIRLEATSMCKAYRLSEAHELR